MKDIHKQLQDVGLRWLYARGCGAFAKEVPTANGIADVLGVKINDTYYIEAKASRSDLVCLKQKMVYRRAIGDIQDSCYYHAFNRGENVNDPKQPRATCERCIEIDKRRGDTGIDFYYIIVAEGLKVEPELYPGFGVLDHKGNLVRRAKRMKNDRATLHATVMSIAHVLVYKAYGKLYFGEQTT